ncbi:MAG: hypothetical protein PHF84_02680 [bacterium]|nr:hypothetical protein [bacterium]
MIKRTFFMIIVLMFLLSGLCPADTVNKRDPILAGVLSWYMPGLGQFYAGQYLKGSIYWVVENTLFISAVLTIADLNFSVNKDIGFQFNVKPKEYVSKKDKTIAITLAVSYIAFHVFNVIDAIRTTVTVNREMESGSSRLSFQYMNIASDNYFMMNYRF